MCLIFVLYMYIVLIGLVNISKSESTNDELVNKHNEMSLLLELHTAFCGEDVLCKNDSSFWEIPGELVMPKPCCLPCSCSATYQNRSDCCPAFLENESVKDTRLGTSRPSNGNRTNQTYTTDDVIPRPRDAPIEDNVVNNLTSLKTCIRPQVFYKPNSVLDSDAYEMVATCPEWFKDSAIIAKCQAGLGKAELYDVDVYDKNLEDLIPVTSMLTGITYANKHCSVCNGITANATSKFLDWKPTLVGLGADILYRSFLRPTLIIEQTTKQRQGFENIHFIPEHATTSAMCKVYDIQFCNQTGFLGLKNETVINACLNGPDLPIIQTVGGNRLLFKNIACLYCNANNDFNGHLHSCGYWKPIGKFKANMYSISFNLQSMVNNEQKVRVPYIGDSSLRLLEQGRCPPGYAALQVIFFFLNDFLCLKGLNSQFGL